MGLGEVFSLGNVQVKSLRGQVPGGASLQMSEQHSRGRGQGCSETSGQPISEGCRDAGGRLRLGVDRAQRRRTVI